jgi:hypothetical protein
MSDGSTFLRAKRLQRAGASGLTTAAVIFAIGFLLSFRFQGPAEDCFEWSLALGGFAGVAWVIGRVQQQFARSSLGDGEAARLTAMANGAAERERRLGLDPVIDRRPASRILLWAVGGTVLIFGLLFLGILLTT